MEVNRIPPGIPPPDEEDEEDEGIPPFRPSSPY
jgi:hypothetical protein